jgi:hypothetical protein
MSIGLLFWVLVILALIFGPWPFWAGNKFQPVVGNVLLFVLIILLGWAQFGPALHR